MSEESEDLGGDRPRHAARAALQSGLWLAVGNTSSFLVTAVLSVVMGRVLGPDELGRQSLIAYVSSLLVALLVWSFVNMAIRVLGHAYGLGESDNLGRLTRWMSAGQLAGGAVATIVLVVVGLNSDTPSTWLIVAAGTAIDTVGLAYMSVIVAERGWAEVARKRMFSLILASIFGIVAVFIGWGINGVFVGNLIASVVLLVWIRRGRPTVPQASWHPFPRTLVRTWLAFLLLGSLSQIVSQRIEFLFLGAYSTTEQVAIYSVSFMVVTTAAMIPSSIVGGALPSVAQASGEGRGDAAQEAFGSALRVLTAATLLLSAAVFAVGPPLIAFIYGPEFLEAARLVSLLALGLMPASVAAFCWAYLLGHGKTEVPIIAGSTAAVVDLALAFVLVPKFDALGAAIANVVAQFVLVSVIVYLSWRVGGRTTLHLRRLLGPLAFSLVVGIALRLAVGAYGFSTESQAIVGLLVGGVVFMAISLALGTTVGFVAHTDGAWLRASLPPKLAGMAWLFVGRKFRGRVPAN